MREAVVGAAIIALVIGLAVGRRAERTRRTFKDWGTAKATTNKARQIAFGELRKSAGGLLLVGGILLVLFLAAVGGNR